MRLVMVSASLLLSTQAFAEDGPVTSPTQTNQVPAAAPATSDQTAGQISAKATPDTGDAVWSLPIIDRPYVLPKSRLQAYADTPIVHTAATTGTTPTASDTSFGLHLGAGYGVTDKITAGLEYSFAFYDFEIKGPLAVFGEYQLLHKERLSVAASADVTFDFDGTNSTGGNALDVGVHAGVGARYLVAPKMAVYTGSPYGPGPVGRQFNVPTDGDNAITFDLPLGFAYQALPQLFAYADTRVLQVNIANKGMNDDTAVIIGSDTGGVPLTLGGLYTLTRVLDITAALVSPDLTDFGDKWGVSVGARWHN